MQATVSVAIPAYNAAAFIVETLDSVACQTHLPDEIIIVDDGSTDNTHELVASWLTGHPELSAKLIQQKNQGASAARNTAIANTTKDYIAFLDADDLLLPQHLETLLAGVDLCSECVIVFADQEVFSDEKVITKSFLQNKPVLDLPFKSVDDFRLITCPLWFMLIQSNYIPTSASLVKRSAAVSVGGFDLSLATSEDRHFLLKVSRLGCAGYFNKVIARKREHETNLTHKRNELKVAKNAVVIIEIILRDSPLYSLTIDELEQTKKALSSSVSSYIYIASISSFSEYLAAIYYLLRLKQYRHILNVKHFLRAVFFSIRYLLPRIEIRN